VGLAGRLPESIELALRSAALPWFLGMRWWGHQGHEGFEGVPRARRSLGLAAKIAADEFFLATEIVMGHVMAAGQLPRIGRELDRAERLFSRRGWLQDPTRYHQTPSAASDPELREARSGGARYLHLSFESGYTPDPDEPGRSRWLSYEPNHRAHAWLMRHPGPERPWVVCIPGYRMGNPVVDFTGFRASWLHEELGLNVAIPVLPFHGPRRTFRRGGDGFLTGDLLDTVHAQSQAVWDVRRLIRWLRAQGAPAIGAYGLSLGGYTTALVASLESELDCVVAGIPAACFLGLARWNAPAPLVRLADRLGFPWERLERVLTVISPLAFSPRVPRDRRFLFAGLADRLAPPDQARDLWRHWGRPRLAWYHGSHTSFCIEPGVQSLLLEAFRKTGLLKRRARAAGSRVRHTAATRPSVGIA
jgi:dienelactone hydrolase